MQAQTLETDPTNKGALSSLNSDLTNVSSSLGLIVTFITGALNAIKGFKDELPTLATNLQTIATDSTKAARADQAQIDKLNADIDTLHAEIKSLTASIMALGIVDGVALTRGILATIAAFPEGALVCIVLGLRLQWPVLILLSMVLKLRLITQRLKPMKRRSRVWQQS